MGLSVAILAQGIAHAVSVSTYSSVVSVLIMTTESNHVEDAPAELHVETHYCVNRNICFRICWKMDFVKNSFVCLVCFVL